MTDNAWFACPHCIQPLGTNSRHCHYCNKDVIPCLMTNEDLTDKEHIWRGVSRLREEDLNKAEREFDDSFKSDTISDTKFQQTIDTLAVYNTNGNCDGE